MIALTVLLAAAATWLLTRPAADGRLTARHALAGRPRTRAAGIPRWAVPAASVLAAISAWWLVGGSVGVAAAAAIVVILPRLLRRLESRPDRARREALDRQAPLLADLLAATLSTGATFRSALGAVTVAVGEPTASALRPIITAIDLGADPVEAWRSCRVSGSHALVIDAVVRAAESGAPVSRVLTRLADDLRREHRVVVEVAARSAGVRAVAPLAACFLPAFVLLGVVPVVASLAGSVVR